MCLMFARLIFPCTVDLSHPRQLSSPIHFTNNTIEFTHSECVNNCVLVNELRRPLHSCSMRFTGSVMLISTVTHHSQICRQTLDLRQITHFSNCIGMTIGTRCRQTV